MRYDEQRAGPLASLVAPPHDVLDATARDWYMAASPHNVVHLTLSDSEVEAATLWSAWLAEGILVPEEEAACWWLAQEYVGPDGLARLREGLVCALRVEPYEAGRPAARAYACRAEGGAPSACCGRSGRRWSRSSFSTTGGSVRPDGENVLEVELEGVRRLWRIVGDPPEVLADARLLIADGHHRYETTLAYHAEEGKEESAWTLVVIVPTEQEGLTISPRTA